MLADAPASLFSDSSPNLLQAVLEISLTGYVLFRPLYDAAQPATLTDLGYAYVNPAAQRMLQLPECPTETFLTLYPDAAEAGIFAFYRDIYLTNQSGRLNVTHQRDGVTTDSYLAARRAGDLLVVSCCDTATQSRTALEEALRQSQAREQQAYAAAEQERTLFQTVFAQAPVGFALFQGEQHHVTLANDRVCSMLGYPAAEVLGRPLLEGVPELRGQGFGELLAEVGRTGVPFIGTELPAKLRQSAAQVQTHYFNFVYQPVYDGSGSLLGVVCVVVDVTEQVLSRRQLQQLNQELEARVSERTQALLQAQAESEAAMQRLRYITQSLPSTSFTVDATGEIVYISPQWYAYTGMAADVPVNEAWPRFIHPEDLPSITHEYSAALAGGRAWRYEFRLRGASGQYRWFTSQGMPEPLEVAIAAGRPRQWFGSNLDIDDLKQAQQAQQRQQKLLRDILQQSPAMIATLEGPQHRFTFANPGYHSLVKGRIQLGQSVAECLPEVVPQGFIELLDDVYRTGESFIGRETPVAFHSPDGTSVSYYLDVTYQALRDAHHTITGVLAFVLDVTERVRTRQLAEISQTQLLAAAEQAAAQRESFHQVFEQTPALIQLVREPGHRIDYVNPAYQRLFPGRQLVGLEVAEAIPELREQGFTTLMDRVYETGETYHGADTPFSLTPGIDQPAHTTYYTFTYQAYREHGRIAGLSVFAYDVTEQVLARQAREAQQRELEQLFMLAPAPIIILDGPDFVFQLVNPAYQQIFPGRALLGLPLLKALPELRATPVPGLLRHVFETGASYTAHEMPLRMARSAGRPLEEIYWTFTYQARRTSHGAIDGVHVFAHDVTEQILARREREGQAQRLAAVFEQAPVAICVFRGPEYILDLVNPPMAAMLGRPLADVLGRPFLEVLPEVATQGLPELLDEVRRTGIRFVAHERMIMLAHHAPGAPGCYNFVYEPQRDEQGSVTAVICVATDVSEQVRSRQQVQQLNQELTAANQQLTHTNVDLDTFIYTASHDLKAPITNIEGLLSTLRDELPPIEAGSTVAYILDLMQDSVERFTHTIHHLTDVSRLHKEYDQPRHPVALAPIIEGVRLDLAPLLHETDGQLEIQVEAVATVTFSEKNLRSVVFNLLSNALKYRHPNRPPRVRLRVRQEESEIVLDVYDNGLGFDQSREQQLFAMFQRLHTHVEGSGVGLYMVKRLVENAGGRILVESEIGVGSRFTVYLPR
jgi:two-component system, sensor histidine kinase